MSLARTPNFSASDIPMCTTGRRYVKPTCLEPQAMIIPIEGGSGPYPKYLRAYINLSPHVIVPAHRRGNTNRTLVVRRGEIVVAIHTGVGHLGDWQVYEMNANSIPIVVEPHEWLVLTTSEHDCFISTHWLQRDLSLPGVVWEQDAVALFGTVSP